MKKPKILSLSITIIFAITCIFPFYSSDASAAPNSFNIAKWKTAELYEEYYSDDEDEPLFEDETGTSVYYYYERFPEERSFTLPKAGYVRILYSITPIFLFNSDDEEIDDDVLESDIVDKGAVKFILMSGNKEIEHYTINMTDYEYNEKNEGWVSFETKCKAGNRYTLKMTSSGKSVSDADAMYKVKYKMIGYTKYATSASIKKKVATRGDSWVKIGKFKNGLPYYKRLKYNKKYIDDWWIKNDGSLYVYAKRKGKTTVTTILKNGKKYKTKITIKHGYPNFFAYLSSYKTRNNYFTVKIKNLGTRKLTIIRKGAKVLDKDYKSYDRKIKGHKNVVIKPGKTKTVRFYVKGRTTWPNYKHFTLRAHFKYDGKKFKWKTGNTFSWYKEGKKWVDTFWNFDEYEDWE